jgi:hypothetical protein
MTVNGVGAALCAALFFYLLAVVGFCWPADQSAIQAVELIVFIWA